MAIRVELELDTGEFTTRVVRAGTSLQSLERQVNAMVVAVNDAGGQTKGFLSTMRDVSIVAGAATMAFNGVRGALQGWVGSIIKVNAEMERTTALMRAMSTASNSVKDAANNVAYLRSMVKEAPYSLHALTESFTRMKATGIDPTKGAMQALVDGVAGFGGSEDVLKRSSVALAQMSGKGVVQMEELRQQLGEAMPRATELMARSMGMSYGELVKKVSTGTLEAKSSIAALNLEIERVYGGAARAQMQTFNGMLANSSALWQQLALRVGNTDSANGFMAALKNQLRDLNEFLASGAANVLADRLGAGLTSVVNTLRSTFDWLVTYRQEIYQLGVAFGVAFSIAKVTQFTGMFVGALGNMRSQLALVNTELALFNRNNALASMGRSISVITNGAQGISLFAQSLVMAGGAARMFGVAMSTVAPWLPLVVVGVMAVGDAFGLFSNKARDAWQELEEFGVQSMKQVLVAKELVEQQKRALQGKENLIKAEADGHFGSDDSPEKARYIADQERDQGVIEDRSNLAKNVAQWAKFQAEAEVIESRKAAEAVLRDIDKTMGDKQRQYDDVQRIAQKAHETELNALAAAGKSGDAEVASYRANQRRDALAFYDDQLKMLNEFYQKARDAANPDRGERDDEGAHLRAMAGRTTQTMLEERLKQMEAARAAQAAAPLGAVLISTPVSDESLMKKGEKRLVAIKAEIADLKAELAGAHGEAEKLAYQLQQGKYGDQGNAEVQKLTESLIEAQKEKDKLDELMRGKKELINDLDNLRIKNLQEIAELNAKINGQELSDLEKIKIKAQNGGYAGVLPGTDAIQTFQNLTTKMKETSDTAGEVGDTIKTNTFGQATLAKGQTMLDQILKITEAWMNLKTNVNGTNFGGAFGTFNGPGGGMMNVSNATPMKGGAIYNEMLPVVAKAFLMAVQSVESGGSPNIRYGGAGGSKYFSSFADHPRIKETIPSGPNAGKTSDAAGTYQFLSSTWDRLGGGAFTPANQEAMAWKLAQQDYARNTGGRSLMEDLQNGGMNSNITGALGSTWEGFQKNGGKAIATYNATMSNGAPIAKLGEDAAKAAPAVDDINKKVQDVSTSTEELAKKKADLKIVEAMKKLGISAEEAKVKMKGLGKNIEDDADGAGKAVAELTAKIKAGEIDPSDKDPASARYKDLMKAARDADAAEEALAAKKKARNAAMAADDKMAKSKEELDAKMASLKARIDDPNSPRSNDGYISLKADLDKQTQAAEQFYGKGTADYQAFLDRKKALLAQYLNADALGTAAKLSGDNVKLQQSLMTEGQSRKAALDAEIKRLQDLVQNSQATGEARVALEKQVQGRIALLRQQYDTQSGPLGKQMKEWSAFGDNLEKAATGWLDSGVDAIANFVATGKMDFKQLASSIIADMTKVMLKAAIGNMMGKGGQGGGKSSKGGGAKGVGAKSMFKMFGAAHIGGIAGATTMSRSVSPAAFAGAPRFHTGGVLRGMGLGPDEVPIIAKKGEGIFTPQQMKAMGGAGQVNTTQTNLNFTSQINVNAQGGTKEQNEDSAQRTSKAIEGQVRMIVGDEISRQLRPGNAIYSAAKGRR